jgi:predicted MFS family arabinose efflux permease
MDPKDRVLLEQSLKLSRENNQILLKLQSRARWATFWGMLKIAIIVVPLVAGYFYLQPYIEQILGIYSEARNILPLSR